MEVGSFNAKKINAGIVSSENVSLVDRLNKFIGSSANEDGSLDGTDVSLDLTTFLDGVERVNETVSKAVVEESKKLLDWSGELGNTSADLSEKAVSSLPTNFLNGLAWLGKNALKTGASIVNTKIGIVQGLCEFGEALVDAVTLVGAIVTTQHTAILDLINWLWCKFTGAEFSSCTMAMWSQEMEFVSKKFVKDAFDDFHQNSIVGQVLDEYAYAPFKSTGAVYKVADGVGYVSGIILLSLATAGIGGVATAGTGATAAGTSASASTLATLNIGQVATVEITKQSVINAGMASFAGFGKNTQNAWADGASLEEGLTYGGAMALWEGGEMFLGSAINGLKFSGLSGVGGQLATTGAHVALDSVDSASSSFVNPLMQMIYTPNEKNMEQLMYLVNYDENGNKISDKSWDDLTLSEKYDAFFKYNGGWAGVGVNALVGGTVSFLTEIPDIYKSVKTTKLDITQPLPVLDEDLIKTQELPIIDDSSVNTVVKSTSVKPLSQGEIVVKNYLDNLQEMQNQGISLQAYLKQNGINTVSLGSKLQASMYLGDSKLFTLQNAIALYNSNSLSQAEKDTLSNLIQQYTHTSVGNIDIATMLNDFAPFLTDAQKQTAMNMANSGIVDALANSATPEQLNAIFNYTKCGGFEINAWLNDTILPGRSTLARSEFSSIDEIQNIVSGYTTRTGANRVFTTADGSILDGLDSYIASASYDDAIVTYRGLSKLFDYQTEIDVNSLKVGSTFHTQGYQSSSIVEAMNYGLKDDQHNIILQIVVPPNSGKAAYIENVTGVINYGQMEMLIQRDAALTVVGDIEKTVINGVEKTIIPVVIN